MTDDTTRAHAVDDVGGSRPDDGSAPMALSQRLRQPRTIISILVPLIVIAAFVYLNRDILGTVPGLIFQANPALFLAAFVVYYLGFPLRGYRWHRLLKGTGVDVKTK